MPGQPRTKRRRTRQGFSTVHPDAAGIDVGFRFHVVAVSADRDPEPVRTFRSFTHDLHRLADWLAAVGISTVAMESTGVYWIPLFETFEARGFEVLLVNAREVKHVPGRKTDVKDCQWLQQLHQFGLLRGSFRPHQDVVALRAYLRQRERLKVRGLTHPAYAEGIPNEQRGVGARMRAGLRASNRRARHTDAETLPSSVIRFRIVTSRLAR